MTDVLEDGQQVEPGPRARSGRRRLWLWAASLLTVVAAIVLFWFQPQRLLLDERVDERIPVSAGTPADSLSGAAGGDAALPTTMATEPAEPIELSRGQFVSLDHATSGVARLLELGNGSRIVRLEGLDTDNGPDLYVYLSANPADGDEGAFDDVIVNLGRLKGNQGDQNYDVPPDVDLSRFATIVIWCDRFDSAFGAAGISPT